ncbi:MAG: diadenylate cyclase CdaA [Oscillospiraceae bacterium]|jgi:diadenylate cyclase|nr:diadenylate cyclase CdaA [Oscillospiraceae bacterium]
MEAVRELAYLVWNNIKLISVWDVLDVAIVAYLIYRILRVVRRTSAGSVINGIALLLAVTGLASLLNLNVISYVIEQAMRMGVIILIILFQPELRKFLEQVGSQNFNRLLGKRRVNTQLVRACIEATAAACSEMSKTRTGALIVFERDIGLTDYVTTGTRIDSATSSELLRSIFFPKTPLHDGAVIVRDCRVEAAGCMLPMSHNTDLGRDLGMRHRASLGISERSDAVAVVVSEETGGISVAIDGLLRRDLPTAILEEVLADELIQPEQVKPKQRRKRVKE